MSQSEYVFFIAHAGPDLDAAKELRNLLEPALRVFLDGHDLRLGDQWDIELPKHQQRALATVALVSRSTELAYYLREEIATAIAMERHDAAAHRLIPVYLDGMPNNPGDIPYGLRSKHALDASKLGMPAVAEELRKFANALTQAGSIPELPELARPADRLALYEALLRLLPGMFEEVLFRSGAPLAHLAPNTVAQARRALDLVQWSESEGVPTMRSLTQAIRRVAPGAIR